MRSRDGFTMVELLVVLILIGITGGFAAIQIGKGLTQTRAQRAAAMMATDMKLAHSLSARSRKPMRISVDTAGKVFRVVDEAAWTTVYSERHFGQAGDVPVQYMHASDTSLVVYPNGLAAGSMRITVRAGSNRRVIRMSPAGLVRVSEQ
jgi:prepilin-type N-terminal cleavage/methylation domain-containing protein